MGRYYLDHTHTHVKGHWAKKWAGPTHAGTCPTVTGQLADTPTRGLPTRGLDISRTGQLAD